MGEAPDVPELQEDLAAFRVYRGRHQPPSSDLFGRIYSRRPGIALTGRRDLGRLGDQQTGRGALRVIRRVEFVRDVGAVRCPVAGQRRHDDPVGQRDRAEVERCEERVGGLFGHCFLVFAFLRWRSGRSAP